MVSVLFALAAAVTGSLTLVTQHVASTGAPASRKGWRLARYLVLNPLWLFGVAAAMGSFVFQAIALYHGRLSVVQSILISELVFSLVIGRLWLRVHVPSAAWASAALASAGLAVFLIMSEPEGGHPYATSEAWLPALLACGAAIAACVALARRGSPVRRGALYATASAIVGATVATFVKSTTETLANKGIPALFLHVPFYGLFLAATLGVVLTQAALHHGPLAVSQPLMVIVNPIFSIILGVWLYGEHFTGGALRISAAALAFAVMVVGVVVLARTAPSFEAALATREMPTE
jgi:drug/metabolite transporter (DMT)-like permease